EIVIKSAVLEESDFDGIRVIDERENFVALDGLRHLDLIHELREESLIFLVPDVRVLRDILRLASHRHQGEEDGNEPLHDNLIELWNLFHDTAEQAALKVWDEERGVPRGCEG